MGKEGGEMLSMRTDLKIKFESKIILLSCSVANDVNHTKFHAVYPVKPTFPPSIGKLTGNHCLERWGIYKCFLSRVPSKFLF